MWLSGENLTATESTEIIKFLVNLAWIFNFSFIFLAMLHAHRKSSHCGLEIKVSLSTRICNWSEACLTHYNSFKMSVKQEKLIFKYQDFSMVLPYAHMQDSHLILIHLSSRDYEGLIFKGIMGTVKWTTSNFFLL